jgi:uncharacterized protein (TIGR02646 family)
MIQLKAKQHAAAPRKLSVDGTAVTILLKKAHDKGERDFDFNPKIYGDKTVKAELIKLQHDKCCFCESKISVISHGDVEHYRPKAGWVQANEKLNKPGYYWLAYEWSNLMFSCQICNQTHKKNFFPLLNPKKRAKSHKDNIADEQPLLINPSTEDPEAHIDFNQHSVIAIDGNERGKITINKLGLDRDTLNEKRMSKLNPIKLLYSLVIETNLISEEKSKEALKLFNDIVKEDSEYSSMFKSFFRKNPLPNS